MILLLGASGWVGTTFRQCLTRKKLEYHSLSRKDVDYTREDVLTAFLRETKPEFLINAAGYTGRPNVDACEVYRAECLAGNAVLPGIIRAACEVTRTPWGHVSSGCIFTGSRADGGGFREDDEPNFCFRHNNCSFYSGCKALGEEVLLGAENCFLWRLRIPFTNVDSGRNYLSKLMRYPRLLDAENSLADLDEFADAAITCWTDRVPFGTYHLSNPGKVTTREVTELIRASGVCDRKFEFFESEEEFMRLAAKTPRSNSVLDSSKAVSAGLKLTEVHDAVARALRNWVSA